MNRLLDIGFKHAGHWLLENDKLIFRLDNYASQQNILYAFVCDGQVMYVGKTVSRLHRRMSGYKSPGQTQTTNIRNHEHISKVLLSGAAVEILALPDNGLFHYGQFHFNLAAGLEDNIIKVINPKWNGGKVSSESATITDNQQIFPEPIGSFSLILQPTYYRTGFFNVGVKNDKYFGSDGQEIEIYCGDSEQPILGLINRGATTNGTPRIMGGTGLRDWFQKKCSVNQMITIFIISPTAIQIVPGELSQAV